MSNIAIKTRPQEAIKPELAQFHPVIARILQSRGVTSAEECDSPICLKYTLCPNCMV